MLDWASGACSMQPMIPGDGPCVALGHATSIPRYSLEESACEPCVISDRCRDWGSSPLPGTRVEQGSACVKITPRSSPDFEISAGCPTPPRAKIAQVLLCMCGYSTDSIGDHYGRSPCRHMGGRRPKERFLVQLSTGRVPWNGHSPRNVDWGGTAQEGIINGIRVGGPDTAASRRRSYKRVPVRDETSCLGGLRRGTSGAHFGSVLPFLNAVAYSGKHSNGSRGLERAGRNP
jgi:hypothetical protein